MKIGIIGTGRMGSTLGKLWADQAHEIYFGSRTPEKAVKLAATTGQTTQGGTYGEAAAFGEVILIATQWVGVEQALDQIRDFVDNKVVLDCTLPLVNRELAVDGRSSGAQEIAKQIPKAKVVKVFNTIDYRHFENSPFGTNQLCAYCCSDDQSAKKMAAQLADDIGCEPIDAGTLEMARSVEGLGFLILYCAYGCDYGIDITFRMVQADVARKANWWKGPPA